MKNFKKIGLIVLIIFVVLSMALVAACKEEHEHDFSKVEYDETSHWNVCPEDQVKDEGSIAAHSFGYESDGTQHWQVCSACGYATEKTNHNYKYESNDSQHWMACSDCGHIDESTLANHVDEGEDGKCDVCNHSVSVPEKYGQITGKVFFHKAGETLSATDFSISITDESGKIDPDDLVIKDGEFSFSALEGEYTLVLSAKGYFAAEQEIELSEDDPINIDINLEYDLLMVADSPHYDVERHGFLHQNDDKAYIEYTSSGAVGTTLDAITTDYMDDAMIIWYAQSGLTLNADQRIGVWAQFYNDNGNPDSVWFTIKGKDLIFEWYGGTYWTDNNPITDVWGFANNNLNEEEILQYQNGELAIGLARHENMLFAVVNGVIRDTIVLDPSYADKNCSLGLLGWDPGTTQRGEIIKFYFDIVDDISFILDDYLKNFKMIGNDILGWNKQTENSFDFTTGEGTIKALNDMIMNKSKCSYNNFAITQYLSTNSCRDNGQGVFITFGDKYIWVSAKNEEEGYAIEWNCATWMHESDKSRNLGAATKTSIAPNEWLFYDVFGNATYQGSNALNETERALIEEGKLPLTLVRNGQMIYVFLNNKYIGVRDLGAEYASVPAYFGFSLYGIQDYNTGIVNYRLEEDISSYLAVCEGELNVEIIGEHITAKGNGSYNMNDIANISWTVDDGYVINGIDVNGQELAKYNYSQTIWVNDVNGMKIQITTEEESKVNDFDQNTIGDVGVGDASKVDYGEKGILKVVENTQLFAVASQTRYNGALSVTFKKSLTDGKIMGIAYAFGGGNACSTWRNTQDSVTFRIENYENNGQKAKVQWVGDWYYGMCPVNWNWDIDANIKGYWPMSDELYAAYESGDGITLTLARKDNVFYSFVNGILVSSQYIDKYQGNEGLFCVLADGAQAGESVNYEFLSEEAVDRMLQASAVLISGDAEVKVNNVIGTVSYEEGKVAFDGSGIVSVGEGSLHEKVAMNVGTKYTADGIGQMGIMYRFADGRFVYIRSQKTGDDTFKIQYSQDSVMNRAGDAYLKGWLDFNQEDKSIINAFFNDSVQISLERNGNVFTVKLGDTVLNTLEIDAKYAEMEGQMLVEVDNGSNTAVEFSYENLVEASVSE